MSIQIVTKEEAMAWLHYDEEPAELTMLIEGVSDAVIRYLGDNATFVDSSGELDTDALPQAVKLAALVWMAPLDQDREGKSKEDALASLVNGEPPLGVVRLLALLRDPTLA